MFPGGFVLDCAIGADGWAGVNSNFSRHCVFLSVHFLSVLWPGTARAKGQLAATLRRIYLT